ncbi:MAG: hypothetical protein ALAOOOJD_04728 [bacterium]|nr:hypothetical protein [bacterium]
MRFDHCCLLIIITALLAGSNAMSKSDHRAAESAAAPKVRVQIQIVADSSNALEADLTVPVGTPARDLMDRLFKMNYVDFRHRFVNGIAGFIIATGEKKFWQLEVDGKASEVGIAEIKITQPVRIRWVITAFE